tara:strand:+ start:7947 stop:8426 length:480 start_codon:yes stop_codon:yes gene_type:complete
MSVKSDIVTRIQAIDTGASISESDISNTMVDSAWEDTCDAVSGESNLITSRNTSGTWSAQDEDDYAIDHFKTGIQNIIKAGRATFPYRSTLSGKERYIVYTNNKVYKFPANNVNYFNSTLANIEYYGAAAYFSSVSQSTNQATATNTGNAAVANYNYAQ